VSFFAPYAAVHMPHGVFAVALASAAPVSRTVLVMLLVLLGGFATCRGYWTVGGVKTVRLSPPRTFYVCIASPTSRFGSSKCILHSPRRLCSGVSLLVPLDCPMSCDNPPSGRRMPCPNLRLRLSRNVPFHHLGTRTAFSPIRICVDPPQPLC
jgi:hypothetical protein